MANKKIDIEKEYLKIKKEYNLTLDEEIRLEKMILDYRIKGKTTLREEMDLSQKKSFEIRAQQKATERVKEVESERNDLAKELLKTTKAIENNELGIYSVTKDTAKNYVDSHKAKLADVIASMKNKSLTDAQRDALIDTKQALIKTIGHHQSILDIHEKAGDEVQKMQGYADIAGESANKLAGNIQGIFDKIPGGNFLAKALGLDNAADKLKKGVNVGFEAMTSHIAQGGTKIGAMKAGMSAFNKVVMLNPLLLVVAAGAALFAMLNKVDKKSREISEKTGMNLAASRQLYKETKHFVGNPLKNQLATSEDILTVQQEMIAGMGNMGRLQTGVAAQVAESGKAWGYGAEQAAAIQQNFMELGATGQEAADAQDELAANALKAGVNVGAVMKDVSAHSKDAMRYMSGNVEEIGKAAVKAAKLGVSLGVMTKVADKLLDIEGSLTAQAEFQALTGKQMNLDKARELALSGDIAGATEQVLREVGSIHDFNKLNVLEKKKLAEATGMDVDELQKSLAIQAKMGKMTDEELAAANGLNLSAKQLQEMSAEDLKKAVAKQQATEKAAKGFQDMIDSLQTALLPLAEALSSIFAAIGPILSIAFAPLKWVGKVFNFIFNDLGFISDLLKGIAAYMAIMWIKTKLIGGKGGFGGLVTKAGTFLKSLFSINTASNAELATEQKITAEKQKQNGIMGKAKGLWKKLKGGATGMLSSLKGMTKKGGGAGIGKSMLGGLGKGAKGLGGLITGNMGTIMGGAAMAFGPQLISGAMNMFGGGEEEVPGFASGGEVGSTGIAKVHAGETITPASKVPGSGGGSDMSQVVSVLNQILAKVNQPPVVNLDGAKVSDNVNANNSYKNGNTS